MTTAEKISLAKGIAIFLTLFGILAWLNYQTPEKIAAEKARIQKKIDDACGPRGSEKACDKLYSDWQDEISDNRRYGR